MKNSIDIRTTKTTWSFNRTWSLKTWNSSISPTKERAKWCKSRRSIRSNRKTSSTSHFRNSNNLSPKRTTTRVSSCKPPSTDTVSSPPRETGKKSNKALIVSSNATSSRRRRWRGSRTWQGWSMRLWWRRSRSWIRLIRVWRGSRRWRLSRIRSRTMKDARGRLRCTNRKYRIGLITLRNTSRTQKSLLSPRLSLWKTT